MIKLEKFKNVYLYSYYVLRMLLNNDRMPIIFGLITPESALAQ